jgi:hypothetical protein
MFNFAKPPPVMIMGMSSGGGFTIFAVVGCVVGGIVASMVVTRHGRTIVAPGHRSSRRVTMVSSSQAHEPKVPRVAARSGGRSQKQISAKNPIFKFD